MYRIPSAARSSRRNPSPVARKTSSNWPPRQVRGLRQSLGISSASAQASVEARAALPSNQEAVKFYTAGQERLWAFDYVHASDLLLKAVLLIRAILLRTPPWPMHGPSGLRLKARAEIGRARALSQIWGRKIVC